MVRNEHQRRLAASPEAVGALVDSLASPDDRLWPAERWPAMRLDGPLAVGARGGHGPVRYRVAEYRPGRSVRFRFEAPAGFHGHHEYAVIPLGEEEALLRHSLVMRTTGWARLSWPLFYRPLHDALIEDSLDRACRSLGLAVARPHRWSPLVRLLRTVAVRAAVRR
ncbi:SRPBCC family protein [Thermobifida cellulosilytica]|uniref:Polyketide cyclase n=1 Tax=Thermobifida cellulosilytica TB100 TaxID=665004 RepID=A0A147KHU0_THECS|nr:SRPBCC family protein [Thermobifida cellulosilytica]KUP96864.1 hypothetical protein AC529_09900 [Thermobifida cellulosilytica TB100]